LILGPIKWVLILKRNGNSEGAPKSVVEMIFIYNVNGVDTEFTEKDLMAIQGATLLIEKTK
jgi:hypothetical protein